MTTVTDTIDVDAPISRVYNLWTHFESFPTFMSGVERIVQRTDTDLHWKVKIVGVEREFDAIVTEQIPDERVAWRSVDGEEHAGVVTFHRLDADRTRIALQLDWEPKGFVEKVGAVLQVDDIQIHRDLAKFKELAEQTGGATEGWRGEVDRAADATGN
ncbi:SRPBCC family protein [Agromyces aureus]|uniref:Cyclase n=1 Tax=Agromyces aureus TaxID=453304 RepID=A0A191WD23_9MICO|nr:SRPBCC family protein [Agromyces aureus]ANJ26127.1 cyclase [Agromyces aureus]